MYEFHTNKNSVLFCSNDLDMFLLFDENVLYLYNSYWYGNIMIYRLPKSRGTDQWNVLLYGDEGESHETSSPVFQQVQLIIEETGRFIDHILKLLNQDCKHVSFLFSLCFVLFCFFYLIQFIFYFFESESYLVKQLILISALILSIMKRCTRNVLISLKSTCLFYFCHQLL